MILLDTNVLEAGSFKSLNGPLVGALLAVARAKKENVLLPEIVQHEFLAHRRRGVEAAVEAAKSAIKEVDKTAPGWSSSAATIEWPDPDKVTKPLQDSLNLKLPSLKAGVGLADEALRRETYRLAPASRDWSKPGSGARDATIWLTAVEAAKKGETVYLVSADGRAFGKNDRLLPELQTEAGSCEGKIIYCVGLPGLFGILAEKRELSLPPEQLLETDPAWVAADEMFKFVGATRFGLQLSPNRPSTIYFISNTGPQLAKPPFDVHAYRVEDTTWVAFRAGWSATLRFGIAEYPGAQRPIASHEPEVTLDLTMLARLDNDEQHVIGAEVLDVTRVTPNVQPFSFENFSYDS